MRILPDEVFGRDRRLPADGIEKLVKDSVHRLRQDQLQLMDALSLDTPTLQEMERLTEFSQNKLQGRRTDDVVQQIIKRVIVSEDKLTLELNITNLRDFIGLQPIENEKKTYRFNIPIKLRRRGVETKMVVLNAAHVQPRKVPNLIKLIARSTAWFEKLQRGETSSLEEIAKKERMSASDVSRYLPLAFLAPDIVASIAKGRQPIELSVQRLKRLSPLPIDWDEQRCLLGYPI